MGLSILSNIPSLVAQNQLSITNTDLQNTLFQLSSGSKINSGADDPAGLSIADGLQANISALTQSAQNVTDGVGLLQTADGALSQVTTLLNRAVTLATEAGNSGLTTSQQTALNNEFSSITNEIDQIGTNTTYNNTPVFTGSTMSVFLSDGSATDAVNPTISVNMPSLSATSIGLGSFAASTFTLTGAPNAGDTVAIGAQTYTFVAAGNVTAAGDVAIGSGSGTTAIQNSLLNLQAAINGGAGAGTTYMAAATGVGSATGANPSAEVTEVAGNSMIVQSRTAGTGAAASGTIDTANYVPASGNDIATLYTVAGSDTSVGSWLNAADTSADMSGGSGGAVDLNSATDAQTALTAIENAIAAVAADRGAMGSGINQMNAAVQVMNNTSQNLSSSLSGIQDANMGQVVANMSKYQVLEQTGIAALAQSNSNEQAVLKLLQ